MRRAWDRLATVLGIAQRGLYIPYGGAQALPPRGTLPAYEPVAAALLARETAFLEHFAAIERLTQLLESLGGDPPAPRWTQDWFPRLDGAAAYAMVHRLRPRRIVEVGSGHSTRFFARAIADAGTATVLTAIDPEPRASLDGLAVEFVRARVQEVGLSHFSTLAANDVVFIDSSHVLMPGTDVDHLLNRVLPLLPAGVCVHFHDIYLPRDYPADWGWRGYNEQLAVAALVTSGAYAAEFASGWVVANRPDWIARSVIGRLPLMPGARESSLWLRKR